MTCLQALQGFPDKSQVSLHKNNKTILPFFLAVPAGSREMTFAFNFKNERTFVFSLFYRFSHVAD
jgi:hypothetical protein